MHYPKILLKGERHDTAPLLEKIINETQNRRGFLTRDATENGKKKGFYIVPHYGQGYDGENIITLASDNFQTEHEIAVKEGEALHRYRLDLTTFDDALYPLFDSKEGELTYLDGIGRLQMASELFRTLVETYISSPNLFIGTIEELYADEFTAKRDDDVLITVFNVDQLKADEVEDYARKILFRSL